MNTPIRPNCATTIEALHAVLNGRTTLPPEVEAHLAICPACAAEWRALDEVEEALRAAGAAELSDAIPPAGLQARVMAEIHAAAEPAPRRVRRPIWRPLAWAAAALLAVASMAVLLAPREDQQHPAPLAQAPLPQPAPQIAAQQIATATIAPVTGHPRALFGNIPLGQPVPSQPQQEVAIAIPLDLTPLIPLLRPQPLPAPERAGLLAQTQVGFGNAMRQLWAPVASAGRLVARPPLGPVSPFTLFEPEATPPQSTPNA